MLHCSSDVANREMEAVAQMREAVQMVETAALEKEQVLLAFQVLAWFYMVQTTYSTSVYNRDH